MCVCVRFTIRKIRGRQSNLLEVSFPAISLITYVVQQMKLTCALNAFPIRIRSPFPSPSSALSLAVSLAFCVHFGMHLILEITLTILNGHPLTHDTPCSLHLSHVPFRMQQQQLASLQLGPNTWLGCQLPN